MAAADAEIGHSFVAKMFADELAGYRVVDAEELLDRPREERLPAVAGGTAPAAT